MAKYSGRGPHGDWTLEVETEWIDISSGFGSLEPDPDWHYVDLAGHEHSHTSESFKRIQVEENWFDQDGIEHNGRYHFECKGCGEWIVPGTRYVPPDFARRQIPGMIHYILTRDDGHMKSTEYLTQEEADAWMRDHYESG